jgi:phosphoglycolate phosphatase
MPGRDGLRAALIDLDGTLMDTAPDLAEAANRMRADFALPSLPVSRVAQYVGKGADVLVHRSLTDRLDGQVGPERFVPARASFLRHYHAVNGQASVVFEGVPQALMRLRARGWRLACVTNKPREFTLPLLQRARLAPLLDAVVCGDEVERRKPHPDGLLQACSRLGVAPGQAVMIGDSINDVLAARGAGLRVILVESGYNEGESVASLSDQPGVDAIVPGLVEAACWLDPPTCDGTSPRS